MFKEGLSLSLAVNYLLALWLWARESAFSHRVTGVIKGMWICFQHSENVNYLNSWRWEWYFHRIVPYYIKAMYVCCSAVWMVILNCFSSEISQHRHSGWETLRARQKKGGWSWGLKPGSVLCVFLCLGRRWPLWNSVSIPVAEGWFLLAITVCDLYHLKEYCSEGYILRYSALFATSSFFLFCLYQKGKASTWLQKWFLPNALKCFLHGL